MSWPTRLNDFLEILILTGIFYVILRFLLETRGTGVIRGLTILVSLLFIVSLFLIEVLNLVRLKHVYDNLVNIFVIGLIVIFQPEIRRGITQLGDHRLFAKVFGGLSAKSAGVAEEIVAACRAMARRKIGALIAIERSASLQPYLHTGNKGTPIDAKVDNLLLQTIFQPGAPLHDGAVLIQGDRIIGAGCLLPLSRNENIPKKYGTRHHAAVGLSEVADAIVLVVSEEKGTISVAYNGVLHENLDEERIRGFLTRSPETSEEKSSATPGQVGPEGTGPAAAAGGEGTHA